MACWKLTEAEAVIWQFAHFPPASVLQYLHTHKAAVGIVSDPVAVNAAGAEH